MTTRFVHNRKGRLNKKGLALIQLRVTHNGKSYFLSTGIHISPKDWDENKERVKSKNNNSIRYNQILSELDAFCSRYQDEYKRKASPDELIRKLKGEESPGEKVLLFFKEYYNEQENELKPNTIKQHKNFLKLLTKFNRNLRFTDIDYTFKERFEKWLSKQSTNRGEKMSVNYRALILRLLRNYMNEARKKRKIDIDIFLNEKIKTEETETAFLTSQELELIKCLDLSKRRGYISESREMFVFSCYTGIRYGDAITLTTDNLRHDGKGYRIVLTPQKTKKTKKEINLPLYTIFNGIPEKLIIERLNSESPYDELFGPFEYNFLSTYNQHLKLFAGLAKINKNLSAHVSRHTCAMMLLNDYGASFEVVQAVLGHSSIATTQKHYAKLMTRGLDNRLEDVFNK